MSFIRRMFHVLFVYVLFCKGEDEDYQPTWTIAGSDIFEYVSDVTNMRCGLYQGPCDPESVVLQKFVQGSWQEACIIYNNESYKSLNGHIGERGGAGYSPFIKEFSLAFSPALVEDSGLWRCKVNDCPSETVYSNGLEVVISTNLSAGDILISTPEYILLNSPAEYKCTSGRVYPEANVTWDQAGEISEGNPTNGFDGTFYQIENTNTFTFCERDKMDVSCVLQKTSGISWTVRKSADPKPVFAPAVVEGFNASHTHPAISKILEIFCTGSGSSRAIRWRKDGNTLPDGLFDIETVQISGSFRCEESEALNSTITWIQNDNPTCQDIENHNGKYQCIVTADKDTTDTSRELEIITQYSPILKSSTEEIEAITGETITLVCEVECAMPTLLTYTWSSEHNRDGLDSDSQSVNITVIADDFNNTIICTVNNKVGSNSMTFAINETYIPPIPTISEEPTATFPETTPGGNVTTLKPPNTALIIANAVIWSLCGVVAIVLVCLALYHYRQIQNGKKYHKDNSEEIVLTDDEEKPGTSHGFGSGEYDDISHSVVGKVALGGAFGGVTTEGLYAEVQTSAQTQMPVAPKRASKIKTSQPEPSNPQAKRTHATNAPKSPMDARHQANSPSLAKRQEPQADYSPASKRKDIPPSHSSESNHGMASKVVEQQKRHASPNKQAAVKQHANGTKPSVPVKPDIQSFRSSRSSGINPAGTPYDNAEVNLYANCDQRPEPKNGDGTITYADLALQQDDPYEEGAPPVPKKNMTDQEPVQYASIKRNK